MIILAALLDIGINLLFVALVLITLLLLVVILMQRPKQEGLGAAFGAALTDQAFGARTTDVLKKATIYLGSFFMIVVLVLAILMNKKYRSDVRTLITADQPAAEQTEAPAKPAEEEKPKSIADMIEETGNKEAPAPATETPVAPAETPAPQQ